MERMILIQVSTQVILDSNANYFRGDWNLPPDGLDPDLEYLIEREAAPPPVVDTRLIDVFTHKTITTTPHPVYTHFNQYQVTYTTAEKSEAERIQAVFDREIVANDELFTSIQRTKYNTIAIAVNAKNIAGDPVPAQEADIQSEYLLRAELMYDNHLNAESLITDIIAGTPIDLDSGWALLPPLPTP